MEWYRGTWKKGIWSKFKQTKCGQDEDRLLYKNIWEEKKQKTNNLFMKLFYAMCFYYILILSDFSHSFISSVLTQADVLDTLRIT